MFILGFSLNELHLESCSPWSFPAWFLKHPWKNQGMHFCGISTEWLKCRQYHQKLKNKAAWVLDLQAGTRAVNYSLEYWSKNSLLSVQQGGIAGQGQHPGALAQQGRGTGTTCFTLGALNALSSQTEVVGKARPTWLLFSVCFECKLNETLGGIHVPVVTSLHHCPAGSGLS